MRPAALLLPLLLLAAPAPAAAQAIRPVMPRAGQQAPPAAFPAPAPPAPAPAPAPLPTDPAGPNRAPGIALPDPVTVPADRGGFVKVTATVAAGSEVSFDIATVFDGDAEVQTDQVGTTLYVGLPRVPGTIRIAACTVLDGKPTKIVYTLIVIEAAKPEPAPAPTPTPAPPADPLAVTPGAHLHVTFLGTRPGDALRRRLVTAGCTVYDYATPPADRPDLADEVKRAGGLPLVVVQTDDGAVGAAGKPVDEGAVVRLVNAARAGGK